jgi:ribose transport system permease protein
MTTIDQSPDTVVAVPATAGPPRRGRRVVRAPEFTLSCLAVVGFAAMTWATHGNMLSGDTLSVFFRFLAVPIVIGLSQMVVLAIGQMNLSVGVLTGYCAMVAAWLMISAGWPAPIAVIAAIVLGGVVGALNGLLVVLTRINAFIVTLATMTIIDGLRYRVHGPDTFQDYSPALQRFGRGSVLGLPNVFIVAVVVAVLVGLFFARTVAGRQLLASGGSPFSARLSGISNNRSIILAHVISGLLAGVAAVIIVALSGSVNSSVGDDLLLPSFAAPIIGGVALAGGVVAVLGTCLAAFLVRLVDVAQAQFGLNQEWVDLIVGAVVLGAVLIGAVRQKMSGRAT